MKQDKDQSHAQACTGAEERNRAEDGEIVWWRHTPQTSQMDSVEGGDMACLHDNAIEGDLHSARVSGERPLP